MVRPDWNRQYCQVIPMKSQRNLHEHRWHASRLYSIASSPLLRGSTVELCCRVAQYTATPLNQQSARRRAEKILGWVVVVVTWDGTSSSLSSSKNRLGPLSSSKKPPAFAMENMGKSPFWIGESYRNWRFLYGYVKLPEATHHREGGLSGFNHQENVDIQKWCSNDGFKHK